MQTRVKNLDSVMHTWGGQEFEPDMVYTLQDPDFTRFAADVSFFAALGEGTAQVGDGAKFFTNPIDGWSYLIGDSPGTVELSSPKALDDKPLVQSTPRPVGTYTYFSSRDDDSSNPSQVDHGDYLELNHEIGDDDSVYVDFNVNAIINPTHIHGAFIQWTGAKRDSVECEIVAPASPLGTGTNTNYEVVSGILIMVPGIGTKTVPDWDAIKPVQMVKNEFGVRPDGYWDATYNTSTNKFENYTFRADGTGEFNIFAEEIELNCFMPCHLMIGEGSIDLKSYDVTQLGHNMIVRAIFTTRGDDHAWECCGTLHLYRQRTH